MHAVGSQYSALPVNEIFGAEIRGRFGHSCHFVREGAINGVQLFDAPKPNVNLLHRTVSDPFDNRCVASGGAQATRKWFHKLCLTPTKFSLAWGNWRRSLGEAALNPLVDYINESMI